MATGFQSRQSAEGGAEEEDLDEMEKGLSVRAPLSADEKNEPEVA